MTFSEKLNFTNELRWYIRFFSAFVDNSAVKLCIPNSEGLIAKNVWTAHKRTCVSTTVCRKDSLTEILTGSYYFNQSQNRSVIGCDRKFLWHWLSGRLVDESILMSWRNLHGYLVPCRLNHFQAISCSSKNLPLLSNTVCNGESLEIPPKFGAEFGGSEIDNPLSFALTIFSPGSRIYEH